MAESFQLTWAGVPFVTESALVFRMQPVDVEELQRGTEKLVSPLRHQAESEFMDEVEKMLPSHYTEEIHYPTNNPGRNLSAIAHQSEVPNPKVRIGDYYYPTTAKRWSVFRGLATSSQVKEMIRLSSGTTNAGAGTVVNMVPRPFKMKAYPAGAGVDNLTEASFTIETNLYLLPPRPVAEHGGDTDGLFVVTLVDERYYFQGFPVSLKATSSTTWVDLITQLATALNVTITYGSIPAVYGRPETDSHLWSNWENAAVLLDAVAANIGCTVVRKMNGTYALYTPAESKVILDFNRGPANRVTRHAGGDLFVSGNNKLRAGTLVNARNPVVPANINVTFPKYVVGNDPVPHFLNSRYRNQRPSVWYEESYGDVYTVRVPIASGGTYVRGIAGTAELTFRDTAKALLSGEAQISGTPLNVSGLNALAMQVSQNHWSKQVLASLDEVYVGTYSWTPEGLHDIVWTYSDLAKGSYTRVLRSSWTQVIKDYQHNTPSISGSSAVPGGVGGPSVAQTIRSAFLSGSFSQSGFTYTTTLEKAILSGDTTASFTDISYFPTQNRWKGVFFVSSGIRETVLFEGTSGGIYGGGYSLTGIQVNSGDTISSGGYVLLNSGSDYSLTGNEVILNSGVTGGGNSLSSGGYSLTTSGAQATANGVLIASGAYNSGTIVSGGLIVGIASRSIDGTLNAAYNAGTSVRMLAEQATYGVNLTTTEKGQYVYPAEWTSGGIQGVNVVPQIQTVEVLSNTPWDGGGGGLSYYSGQVLVYKTGAVSGSQYMRKELVWVTPRNYGALKKGFYDGQLAGYSFKFSSGQGTAPVYLVGDSLSSPAFIDSDYNTDQNDFYGFRLRDDMVIRDETPGFVTNKYAGVFAQTIRSINPASGAVPLKTRMISLYPATAVQGRFSGDGQAGMTGAVTHSEQFWGGPKTFAGTTVHDDGLVMGKVQEWSSGKGIDSYATSQITTITTSGLFTTLGTHYLSSGEFVQIFGIHGMDIYNEVATTSPFEGAALIVSEVPSHDTFYVKRATILGVPTSPVVVPLSGSAAFTGDGVAGCSGGYVRRTTPASTSYGTGNRKRPYTGVHVMGGASVTAATGEGTGSQNRGLRMEEARFGDYKSYLYAGSKDAGDNAIAFEVGHMTSGVGGYNAVPSLNYFAGLTSFQLYLGAGLGGINPNGMYLTDNANHYTSLGVGNFAITYAQVEHQTRLMYSGGGYPSLQIRCVSTNGRGTSEGAIGFFAYDNISSGVANREVYIGDEFGFINSHPSLYLAKGPGGSESVAHITADGDVVGGVGLSFLMGRLLQGDGGYFQELGMHMGGGRNCVTLRQQISSGVYEGGDGVDFVYSFGNSGRLYFYGGVLMSGFMG